MNRYTIIGLGLVVIVGAFIFVSTSRNANTNESTNDFDVFASIALTDHDGNSDSLERFRGKPLVINSWAVWCPFCRQELPDFAALQKEFGEAVAVIAIDRGEPLEKAKGYTDELGITNDMVFLLDPSDAFYKAIGGFSMPETIFVNADGDIVFHKRGPMTLEEMREAVNQYLQ
jgi:thiol-disulfide isomerase/thioredoxin